MSDQPIKVSTVPAVLAPFQSLGRDVKILLAVPLAVIGGFFGMILMSAALVGFFLWAPNLALADEEEED